MSIVHEPLHPVRTDVIGEVITVREWKKSCSDPMFLLGVLRFTDEGFQEVTQRQASVAASFMRWLGTNVGSCFLGELMKVAREALPAEERAACSAYWERERRERPLMQVILARPEDYAPIGWFGSLAVNRTVEYTSSDLYEIEMICTWLGTSPEGKAFVARVNEKIKRRLDQEWQWKKAAWRVATFHRCGVRG